MPESNNLKIRVDNIILCEEVRVEGSGKHSILRAMAGNIVVQFPGAIRICLYIEAYSNTLGNHHLTMELNYLGSTVVRGDFELSVTETSEPAVMVFPSFPLFVMKGGMLSVDLITNGRKKRVLTRSIKVLEGTPPNFSTASQPPV